MCPQCSDHGIAWTYGNKVATQVHGPGDEDQIAITGFFTEEGSFVKSEGDINISFSPRQRHGAQSGTGA